MVELGASGLLVAFAAGFVSFLSPCVLPLIPGYLSFVSGVGFDELGARPRRVTLATAAFVVGFGSMFVALGAGQLRRACALHRLCDLGIAFGPGSIEPAIRTTKGGAMSVGAREHAIEMGRLAPRLSLMDERGREVELPAEGAPTVLVFYRGDW